MTNEKAYLLGKFARVALGTANIDYNGRFCMSSAAAATTKAFGLDRSLPFPLEDIAHAARARQVGIRAAGLSGTRGRRPGAARDGSNVVVSAPNAVHVERRLKALDLLVVVDCFLSETAQLAHVVLPSAQWAEEDGTMTNLEGRVILRRRAVDPPEPRRSCRLLGHQLRADRSGGWRLLAMSVRVTVFVPFHWGGEQSANRLTHPALDPTSRMPEFKVYAVRPTELLEHVATVARRKVPCVPMRWASADSTSRSVRTPSARRFSSPHSAASPLGLAARTGWPVFTHAREIVSFLRQLR